jgi:hypothetical protein
MVKGEELELRTIARDAAEERIRNYHGERVERMMNYNKAWDRILGAGKELQVTKLQKIGTVIAAAGLLLASCKSAASPTAATAAITKSVPVLEAADRPAADEESGNRPRSYWYPSIGPEPICDTCEVMKAYVANNTGLPKRIGMAIYKPLAGGGVSLHSAEYAIIQPNVVEGGENNWQLLLNFGGRPLRCLYVAYLSEIEVQFTPFEVNADTDGYMFAAGVFNEDKPLCES